MISPRLTITKTPQQSYKTKINNNPIDLVLDLYNQIMKDHPYQIQINLSPYLERDGCLGRFSCYYRTIEITSTRDIFFTAGVLAHELAHVLDFRDKGFLDKFLSGDYFPILPDFNDHDENWKRWFDLLGHQAKILCPSCIQWEISFSGPEFIEPSKEIKGNIKQFEVHRESFEGEIDFPKDFTITFPEA